MSTPILVQVDPYDERKSLLIPFVTKRVMETCKRVTPEYDPKGFAAAVLSKVVAGDRGTLVLAVVDQDQSKVVGHVVAEVQSAGVVVHQSYTDPGNWGDITERIVASVETWAASLGAQRVQWLVQKDTGPLVKKHGFKVVRYTLEREQGNVKTDGLDHGRAGK